MHIGCHILCHSPSLYLKSGFLSWQLCFLWGRLLNSTQEIILFKLNCFILAFFTFIVGKCNVFPLTCHVVSTYVLSLLSLNLLMKNITINALLTWIFFYWHPLSSFFFFCFLYPHFYILDIFITFFCLWFLSIPLWSDNDLLTQTRTIAMSLVKCASSDTQDQYKLVKDISF